MTEDDDHLLEHLARLFKETYPGQGVAEWRRWLLAEGYMVPSGPGLTKLTDAGRRKAREHIQEYHGRLTANRSHGLGVG